MMSNNIDLLKKDGGHDEVSSLRITPKKEIPSQVLRRSTRKRSVPASYPSVKTPPPSAKKPSKVFHTPSPPVPAPTLTTLPYVVTNNLLL